MHIQLPSSYNAVKEIEQKRAWNDKRFVAILFQAGCEAASFREFLSALFASEWLFACVNFGSSCQVVAIFNRAR